MGTNRRQVALLASLVVGVLLPVLVTAGYLYTRAVDQYASTVAFSVRTESMPSPIELIGGIADIPTSGSADADILFAFIRSQEMVETLDARLGLVEMFSRPEGDPVFGFDPTGSIEDLTDYWRRMVEVIYDPGTGLIEVRALAFAPEDARVIATGVMEESARLIDDLSRVARDDTTAFAREELERAVERLKLARERLTRFRSVTQIVDPSADLQGQMGVLGSLEGQLAATLIDADLLRESTRSGDPRLRQAERRIAVIEARIAAERRKLGQGAGGTGGGDYASLLSEFERLAVDREFAEQSYRAALAAHDQAQAEARRKSRYLAAHIRPTLAQSSEHPRRIVLTAMVGFFALCLWALAALVYYSIRDRR
ncbi:sugar transporter [Alphaproteobacteria bacterium GH1-50]|uniref:Sugar transporter n=1 Tax=Kangsaoukella pontilimi TaxID=2691042 RepID=A0A7C9MSC9_9RHOB|nr:sugar transporter [Kangsaoukella pontilimi]